MDRIRFFAELSVRRNIGFTLLFILTVFIGMSQTWLLAFRSAAILTTLLSAVLLACAYRAGVIDYRRRELWLLLDRWHGLPEHRAHGVIAAIMREVFLSHAEHAAWVAAGLWLLTFSAELVRALDPGLALTLAR